MNYAVSICPATGWWALYIFRPELGGPPIGSAARVLFWESDTDERNGIVWDGLKIVPAQRWCDDPNDFRGYLYDPDAYADPDADAPELWLTIHPQPAT